MRVCVLKQPYVTEFTWASHRWGNAHEILDDFILRAQNFGLVYETQADIWVVGDGRYTSDGYASLRKIVPDATAALYKRHKAVRWQDVPWDEYDIVISIDSIVYDELMEQHPKTLWCYYEYEHSKPSFTESARAPRGKYDLFLNHALTSADKSAAALPRALNFPYLCSRRAFEAVVWPKKHDRVYLDSHCVRREGNLGRFHARLKQAFGMGVIHCKPWDFAHSYMAVAQEVPDRTRVYLNKLGGSKYFLLNRLGGVGQSIPEAAALGTIVLSNPQQVYAARVCHPETYVGARDYDRAASVIRKIQGDVGLQHRILKHQYAGVQKFFLEGPLSILEECLGVKRAAL